MVELHFSKSVDSEFTAISTLITTMARFVSHTQSSLKLLTWNLILFNLIESIKDNNDRV